MTDTLSSTFLGRADASRTLAFGGVALLVVGMLLGEIYAIYISHVANGLIRQNWLAIIDATVRGEMSIVTDSFRSIAQLAETRARTMNAHSHVGAFGLLALVLAYLQPRLQLTEKSKTLVALLFLVGAVMQVVSVYVSQYFPGWVLYIADIGGALVIIAIVMTLWGAWSVTDDQSSWRKHLQVHVNTAASRYLMKSGLLLILLGMVFGLYYAWQMVTHDEPAVYAAMDNAVQEVIANNPDAGRDEIVTFKRMQSKIAITAAAHSHAIEFGFLMLLLALVQRYVILGDCRLRWARVLSVGAYALPVSVFFASLYGLIPAAVFADISGGLVLVSLLGMAVGMIRYTGVADTSDGSGLT